MNQAYWRWKAIVGVKQIVYIYKKCIKYIFLKVYSELEQYQWLFDVWSKRNNKTLCKETKLYWLF